MSRIFRLAIFLIFIFSSNFIFAQVELLPKNEETKQKLNPDFEVKNKYVVQYTNDGKYFIYIAATKEKRPIASYLFYQNDDGSKRLAIYSKLGFRFENIPMDSNYFYNESISVFLLAEERLPKTKKCLEEKKFQTKPISSLILRFPDYPFIDKAGNTYFKVLKCKVEEDCDKKKKAKLVQEVVNVVGVHFENTNTCIVTASSGIYDKEWVTAHEFIHYCGYGEEYHGKPIFDCSHF